jgi:hypothetical protein
MAILIRHDGNRAQEQFENVLGFSIVSVEVLFVG